MRHRPLQAAPEPVLQAMAPYREALVVCVEGLFTWDWRAALCARAGMPFVLGHALATQAIPGGQATHERSAAHTIAVRRRGGLRPRAAGYPADLRATRDRLRRRMPLRRQRAAWLGPLQQSNRQSNRPALGPTLAAKTNRDGGAERCPDPAVPQSLAVDLARIERDDHLRRERELTRLKTATHHDAPTRDLLRTVPGLGALLRLVLLEAIPDMPRFPRRQEVVSYGRLVTWAKASAGTRDGMSGTESGKAARTWAFSEAAVVVLRTSPAGQTDLARVETPQGKGQALTVRAPQRARAVYER